MAIIAKRKIRGRRLLTKGTRSVVDAPLKEAKVHFSGWLLGKNGECVGKGKIMTLTTDWVIKVTNADITQGQNNNNEDIIII